MSAAAPLSVSIILVTHNSAAGLSSGLASLSSGLAPGQIILVDNASQDGSEQLARQLCPQAFILENKSNLGFARGVNQGLSHARGELVLLLNPDAALLPGALQTLARFLQNNPRAAGAGPRQYVDASLNWQWGVIPHPPHWSLLLARRRGFQRLPLIRRRLEALWAADRAVWRGDAPCQAPALSGACLLLRRAALEALGGLDEGYFLFYEDVDLGLRLRQAGWELYALPAAGVIHAGMGSVRRLPAAGRAHLLASGRRYLQRHGDTLTRLLWTAMIWKSPRREGAPQAMPAQPPPAATVLHLPEQIRPPQGPFWVEVSPDPSFIAAAAGVMYRPQEALPPALQELSAGLSIHWRIAPNLNLEK
ncbi:MAG: glycosyltransferase family 2 protein [Chloroflexi bacterium]|nr:glycosyltransferase family 2 protein [Chloroflexota bacterium]